MGRKGREFRATAPPGRLGMEKKDVLIREFLGGRVSRRDFHNGLVATGFTATAAGAVVAGTCRDARAATPKSGGRLRAGFTTSSAGDTLDPTKIVASSDIGRSGLLYNRLIDYIPGEGLVGNLATSWGTERRRHPVDHGDPGRRRVPQRQDAHRRRCRLFLQPAPRPRRRVPGQRLSRRCRVHHRRRSPATSSST